MRGALEETPWDKRAKNQDFSFYGKTRGFCNIFDFRRFCGFECESPGLIMKARLKSRVSRESRNFKSKAVGGAPSDETFKGQSLGLLPLAHGILENRLVGESHFKTVAASVRVVMPLTFFRKSADTREIALGRFV